MRRWIYGRKLLKGEISYRKRNFILSVISVLIAISALIASVMVLRIHDYRTNQILQTKKEQLENRMDSLRNDMRKATLELGFNVLILPQNQDASDWYGKDYGEIYMPEHYVEELATSGLLIARHFLPILQSRVEWEEKNTDIILIGTRGEVPNQDKPYREPMVDPVNKGTIKLGYQLHRKFGLEEGEEVQLKGKQFVVDECYEERGNKDDMSAWIHLKEAQQMVNKQGVINAILALECLCFKETEPGELRSKIRDILPGTQVIEQGSRALAREEARLKVKERAEQSIQSERKHRQNLREVRENITSVLIPVIFIACGIWIAFLALLNFRSRRGEIGILRAMGVPVGKILQVFLSKFFIVGILGGIVGFFGGLLLGYVFSRFLEGSFVWIDPEPSYLASLLVLSVAGAALLSIIAGWIPALSAARQDPAEILHRE
ncbi:MAG: ABC transporter permease [Bacteroidales bacterium]